VIRDDLVDVRVSDAVDPKLHPGVELRVAELDRAYRSLEPDQATNSLAQIFALYLTDYPDVSIFVEHQQVDPSKLIANREKIKMGDIVDGERRYPAEVELIEWIIGSERWVLTAQHRLVVVCRAERYLDFGATGEIAEIPFWNASSKPVILASRVLPRLKHFQTHLCGHLCVPPGCCDGR
jgi:hypothetical protein